ncbi:MAG TPA: alpha/beta hydrolase [Victivallales bacterium]|nr:alpha/beta hydrolase [Victivallales bacterium]
MTKEKLDSIGISDYTIVFSLTKEGQGWYFTHGGYNWDFNCLLKAPTLILAGDKDPEHPWQAAKTVSERINSASFNLLKGAGDPVYRDKPDETSTIIRDFILK